MAETKFYYAQVKAAVERATDKLLREIVFVGEGYAALNIQENNQIDTGFMWNSVYASTPGESHYGAAKAQAEARNPKAEMSPEVRPGQHEAILAVGAEYAIYQEARMSFLWKAVEQLRAEFPQIVKTVKL
jgi:hypothetical protein